MNSWNSKLKSFSHSKGQNCYHVVLIPRMRCPVFKYEATRKLCEEGIKWTCSRNKVEIFTHEVMPDHVHLFIWCLPHKSILKTCSIIKGGTSYYVRSKMPSLRRYPRLWSRGIFFRSVGNVTAQSIRNYIDNSSGNQWHRTREMQKTLF
jgi:putative transposase